MLCDRKGICGYLITYAKLKWFVATKRGLDFWVFFFYFPTFLNCAGSFIHSTSTGEPKAEDLWCWDIKTIAENKQLTIRARSFLKTSNASKLHNRCLWQKERYRYPIINRYPTIRSMLVKDGKLWMDKKNFNRWLVYVCYSRVSPKGVWFDKSPWILCWSCFLREDALGLDWILKCYITFDILLLVIFSP